MMTLAIDGDAAVGDASLNNASHRVDTIYWGAVTGIDTATRGTYFLDAFASTRGEPIGPDPEITLPTPPPPPVEIFSDGFETGDLSAWSVVKNTEDLYILPAAAVVGGLGLAVALDDTAPRFVTDWSPVAQKAYAARFYFDPNGIGMASGDSHVLFRAFDASAKTALQLELRSFQGDYQVRAIAPWDSGGSYSTPWFRLSDDPHWLEVLWQAASNGGASDGWLSLFIDGESVASGSGIDNDMRQVDAVSLGAVAGIDSGTQGGYWFDAFASTAGVPIGPDPEAALPEPPNLLDAIFADGFESGDLLNWSARTNEADLQVDGAAAQVGTLGLVVQLYDTTPRFVTDWSPVGEKEYHARFMLDPNSLFMLDGRSQAIFQVLGGSSKVIARVELRNKSLGYQLRAGLVNEAGQWANTGWWPIEDGPQVVEIDWRAGHFLGATDGSLALWVNDVAAGSVEQVANSSLQVDLVRLGAIAGVDGGTSGSMYFDAFDSRRWSHIGFPEDLPSPEPSATPGDPFSPTPTVTTTGTATATFTPTETEEPTGTATATATATPTP
jgi:hypothetical protein